MNLTCPYCNAFVPIQDSASIQKGARLPCPRCEETFTVEHIPTETKGFNPTTSEPTIPIRRPPNRKTALIVLGCMALMACVGLAYMVVSEKQRRKNDTGIVRKDSGRKDIRNNPKAEKVTPKAPLELEAIRYLPSDTQLVIGAHTAELLQMSEGKALLKKGIQFEQFRTVVQKVESLLVLKLEQIDHFVIGVRSIDTKLFPPIHIVVRAKTAFDQEQIKKQLSTRPIVSKKKPTVHTFTHDSDDVHQRSVDVSDSESRGAGVEDQQQRHLDDANPGAGRQSLSVKAADEDADGIGAEAGAVLDRGSQSGLEEGAQHDVRLPESRQAVSQSAAPLSDTRIMGAEGHFAGGAWVDSLSE